MERSSYVLKFYNKVSSAFSRVTKLYNSWTQKAEFEVDCEETLPYVTVLKRPPTPVQMESVFGEVAVQVQNEMV